MLYPIKEQHKISCRSRKECDRDHGMKKAWTVHGKSELTETEKGETGKEQSQEHAHHFIWLQADCPQRIRPGRPNNQSLILLWFVWLLHENVRRLRSELWRHKNWLFDSRSFQTSFFAREFFFYHKEHDCRPPPNYRVGQTQLDSFWSLITNQSNNTGKLESTFCCR
jgi:hypothetical protein